jgi:hypothetical protein
MTYDTARRSLEYIRERFKSKTISISKNDRKCLNDVINAFNDFGELHPNNLLFYKILIAYFNQLCELYKSKDGIPMDLVLQKIDSKLNTDAKELLNNCVKEINCIALESLIDSGKHQEINKISTNDIEKALRNNLKEFYINNKCIKK